MKRREFLRHLNAYLAVTAVCGCRPAFGFFPGQKSGSGDSGNSMFPDKKVLERPPASDYDEMDESDDFDDSDELAGYHLQGCSLLHYGRGRQSRFRFVRTTGNAWLDKALWEEANYLAFITGYRPSLGILVDHDAPNAFASPRDIISGRSPHGAVAMGLSIMRGKGNQFGATAIQAILVHEWAHIAQFQNNVRPRGRTVRPLELMADCIAGWYHAFRCQQGCREPSPVRAQHAMASVGDRKTNDRGHHGTPEERAAAYIDGYRFAAAGGGGGLNGFFASPFQQQLSNFGNPYSGGNSRGGYGNPYGGGTGGRRTPQFRDAFQYAARKYVG